MIENTYTVVLPAQLHSQPIGCPLSINVKEFGDSFCLELNTFIVYVCVYIAMLVNSFGCSTDLYIYILDTVPPVHIV